MKRMVLTILGCSLFFCSAQAVNVNLVQKEGNLYFLELTNVYANDSATDVLKSIAKYAKKKGFKVFILPDTWISETSCYVGFGNNTSKEFKIDCVNKNYSVWYVDSVLS